MTSAPCQHRWVYAGPQPNTGPIHCQACGTVPDSALAARIRRTDETILEIIDELIRKESGNKA